MAEIIKINTGEDLMKVFEELTFIEIDDEYILFDNFEIYDVLARSSVNLKTADEVLRYEIKGKTIQEHLEGRTYTFEYGGGRGQGGGGMGGGFQFQKGGSDNTKSLYPAEFNTQGRFTSEQGAIAAFAEKYSTADTEYGISVDADGFVYKHVQGGRGSVSINAAGKDHTIVHNHPSRGGSNFSGNDLLAVAMDRNAKSIIALDRSHTHRLTKNAGFDANSFTKALKGARWPSKYNYDQGVDWWLRQNAGKYGYSYSRVIR